MLLTIPIGNNRRRRQRVRSGWREKCFALGANGDEAVHIFGIQENRINGGRRKILLYGGKLIEETLLAWVNGVQEEHDLENLRDCNR
jgi:hypothetical protein